MVNKRKRKISDNTHDLKQDCAEFVSPFHDHFNFRDIDELILNKPMRKKVLVTKDEWREDLLTSVKNYKDVLCYTRNDEVIELYMKHILEHCLISNSIILKNNQKLKIDIDNRPSNFRDQGFTRPKCLLLLPTRNHAYQAIKRLMRIAKLKCEVTKMEKLEEEYGPQSEDLEKKKGLKPADYEAVFAGNDDDYFIMGISIAKKSLHLFSGTDVSDLIVASPLRLKSELYEQVNKADSQNRDDKQEDDLSIGRVNDRKKEKGRKKGDKFVNVEVARSFLSSIEVVVIDGMDVLFMQNWNNVLLILKNLNHVPSHLSTGSSLFRCRDWCRNGHGAQLCQKLIFSNYFIHSAALDLHAYMLNYAGVTEYISAATQPLISVNNLAGDYSLLPFTGSRMEAFKKSILPSLKKGLSYGVLIYVTSVAHFVELKILLEVDQLLDVCFMDECLSDKLLQRYRTQFQQGKVRIMVLPERLHYFRRWRMRGVHHTIFYQLPTFAHFFTEISAFPVLGSRNKSNDDDDGKQESTCKILCDKNDFMDCLILGKLFGSDVVKSLNTDAICI